eukprot:7376409-Prymnesium_polylepis.6
MQLTTQQLEAAAHACFQLSDSAARDPYNTTTNVHGTPRSHGHRVEECAIDGRERARVDCDSAAIHAG